MTNESKKQENINELYFSRSNILIESKHNCSLLENKLIAYGLATFQVTENNDIYSDIPISVLKQYQGINTSNIYRDVKKVANTITKHTVIVENDGLMDNLDTLALLNRKISKINKGRKAFTAFNLVNRVDYIDGDATFRITFGRELLPLISNLSAPYTTSKITTLLSINNNYAYRLYELLSEKEYLLYPKSKKEGRDSVIVRYENLNELRMQLTLVDVDDEKIRETLMKPYKELNESERKIYEKVLQNSMYKKWDDLRRCVIDVAKKSLDENELCPIRFEYQPIRTGRGGKTTGIEFEIFRNERYKYLPTIEQKSRNRESIAEQIQEVRSFMQYEKLTDANIELLLEIAAYDIEKIRSNYELSLKQDYISNFVGWMKKAIEGNWASNKPIELLKDRSEAQTEEIKHMYEEYLQNGDEDIQYYETDGNQISMRFGDEPEEDKAEDTISINDNFIELFMRYSEGTLSPEEDKEMRKMLMEFALKKM